MGCHTSKLALADDSIHVMLAHSVQHQQDGKTQRPRHDHYIPRAPHPLLEAQRTAAVSQQSSATTCCEDESDTEVDVEMNRLLYHAAHHNDTIDPRDLQEYGLTAEAE
jgi:hypothetical protein